MRIVLFDLGETLEHNDVLLPGAEETLQAIGKMRDQNSLAPWLGLVSDYFPASTPDEVEARRQEYFALLTQLDIRSHFEPVARRVTLSTELGVFKPDERLFRLAVDRADPGAGFSDVAFVTENRFHVAACRELGMRAIHFRGPGQIVGDVDRLPDLIPLIRQFVELT